MRPSLCSQLSLCMSAKTWAHSTSLHLILSALKAAPQCTAARGVASKHRALEKQQQPTSKECQWWNMIINLYSLSLQVLPSPQHHSLAWGGNGREEMMIYSIQADHRWIPYSSPPFLCISFFLPFLFNCSTMIYLLKPTNCKCSHKSINIKT